MKVLTCAATRRRLQAYHDEELPISDQIAVGGHIEWCNECAEAFAELRFMRAALRMGAPGRVPLDYDTDASLRAAIVSRMRAEHTASFSAGLREMFEDMHLVYTGLGAAAAAAVCVVIMLGMVRAAMNEAPGMQPIPSMPVTDVAGSLAPGTNQNPMALDEGVAMPRSINEPFASMASDDAVFTLSAVLTREGRVEHLALVDAAQELPNSHPDNDKFMEELMGVVSRARFEPARVAGAPVAVNMVWLFAHTTAVRGGKTEIELPTPAPAPPAAKKRRVALGPAIEKPASV